MCVINTAKFLKNLITYLNIVKYNFQIIFNQHTPT